MSFSENIINEAGLIISDSRSYLLKFFKDNEQFIKFREAENEGSDREFLLSEMTQYSKDFREKLAEFNDLGAIMSSIGIRQVSLLNRLNLFLNMDYQTAVQEGYFPEKKFIVGVTDNKELLETYNETFEILSENYKLILEIGNHEIKK